MQMMLTGDGELRGPPLGSMFVAPVGSAVGSTIENPIRWLLVDAEYHLACLHR